MIIPTTTAAVSIRRISVPAISTMVVPTPSTVAVTIEVLNHSAARRRAGIDRGEVADDTDAHGMASYRLFNRDISAAHLSAAIGETCFPLSVAIIEPGGWPGPSRYRQDVDCACRGLSPRCRYWRSDFLSQDSCRGDRHGQHDLIL